MAIDWEILVNNSIKERIDLYTTIWDHLHNEISDVDIQINGVTLEFNLNQECLKECLQLSYLVTSEFSKNHGFDKKFTKFGKVPIKSHHRISDSKKAAILAMTMSWKFFFLIDLNIVREDSNVVNQNIQTNKANKANEFIKIKTIYKKVASEFIFRCSLSFLGLTIADYREKIISKIMKEDDIKKAIEVEFCKNKKHYQLSELSVELNNKKREAYNCDEDIKKKLIENAFNLYKSREKTDYSMRMFRLVIMTAYNDSRFGYCFQSATFYGMLGVFDFIWNLTSDNLKRFISSYDFFADFMRS